MADDKNNILLHVLFACCLFSECTVVLEEMGSKTGARRSTCLGKFSALSYACMSAGVGAFKVTKSFLLAIANRNGKVRL